MFEIENKRTNFKLMRAFAATLKNDDIDEDVVRSIEDLVYFILIMPEPRCVVFSDVVVAPSFRYRKPKILEIIEVQEKGESLSAIATLAMNFIEANNGWQEVLRTLGDDRELPQYSILKEAAQSVCEVIKNSRYPDNGCIVLPEYVVDRNAIINFPRILIPAFHYKSRLMD